MEDCSAVTKLIEPIIDEMDPIEESYCLQVSSAGVVRPLNRDEHIRFVSEGGMPVTVGLYTAVDGKKEFTGVIEGYDGADVVLFARRSRANPRDNAPLIGEEVDMAASCYMGVSYLARAVYVFCADTEEEYDAVVTRLVKKIMHQSR